jgi:hypothetical protein
MTPFAQPPPRGPDARQTSFGWVTYASRQLLGIGGPIRPSPQPKSRKACD